jgi:hypothetical protein
MKAVYRPAFTAPAAHCAYGYMSDRVLNKLQRGLTALGLWCENWYIKINEGKTQAIYFSRRRRNPENQLQLNEWRKSQVSGYKLYTGQESWQGRSQCVLNPDFWCLLQANNNTTMSSAWWRLWYWADVTYQVGFQHPCCTSQVFFIWYHTVLLCNNFY